MFDTNGNLPPGIHEMTLVNFKDVFGYNAERLKLIDGLEKGISILSKYNVECIYIDGSFVTEKEFPNDFDACWEDSKISEIELLDIESKYPEFFMFNPPRKEQKEKFKGEFWPSSIKLGSGEYILDFFQKDRNGNPKGIVKIKLM